VCVCVLVINVIHITDTYGRVSQFKKDAQSVKWRHLPGLDSPHEHEFITCGYRPWGTCSLLPIGLSEIFSGTLRWPLTSIYCRV